MHVEEQLCVAKLLSFGGPSVFKYLSAEPAVIYSEPLLRSLNRKFKINFLSGKEEKDK